MMNPLISFLRHIKLDRVKLVHRDFSDGYHERLLYREIPNSQRNQARVAMLLEFMPGGSLLEIGCGKGGFISLAQQHFEIEGIDISRATIHAIQGQFGDRVRAANIEQAHLPAASYDAIAAFNILEHLQRPEKAIAKIHHALRPGGVLIGSVPYNGRLIGRIITRIGNFIDRTHVSTFSPDAWMRIFHHAGFTDVIYFGELNLGRNHCRYLRGKGWEHFAFNLMFVCR